ncbi:MAG: DUF1616 domain-containing protein [Anaerolineae bacterium]|nr:DUF1616 domain-containing protein [Anaerolineae bacterium]
MKSKELDSILSILVTSLIILVTLAGLDMGLFQAVTALMMVTFLPGYAITSALFLREPLDLFEELVFALGLSLSVSALGALLLNLTHMGLEAISWILYLGGITLVANTVTLLRLQIEAKPPFYVLKTTFPLNQTMLLVLAGAIVAVAVFIAYQGAATRPRERYTQFWAIWADDSQTVINIGIGNFEGEPVQYTVTFQVPNSSIVEWTGIELTENQTWEIVYELPARYYSATFIEGFLTRVNADDEQEYVILRRTP